MRATTSKPGASVSTRSPWLIHTWCFSPTFHSPSNNARRRDDVDERAAELALVGRDDLAAKLLVKRLLAVADAEQRNAAVEQ